MPPAGTIQPPDEDRVFTVEELTPYVGEFPMLKLFLEYQPDLLTRENYIELLTLSWPEGVPWTAEDEESLPPLMQDWDALEREMDEWRAERGEADGVGLPAKRADEDET